MVELVDTYALGAYASGVQVQVLFRAPWLFTLSTPVAPLLGYFFDSQAFWVFSGF